MMSFLFTGATLTRLARVLMPVDAKTLSVIEPSVVLFQLAKGLAAQM